MPSEDSFERALTQFTDLVLPNVEKITSLVSDPTHSLKTGTSPLLTVLIVNGIYLFMLTVFARLAWRVADATFSLLAKACDATCLLARRLTLRARATPERANHNSSNHSDQGSGTTHESEGVGCNSWDDFAKESSQQSGSRTHDEEILHAFTILGIKACANENEVRRAYLTLMKKYHPDLYMKAPAAEQERVRQAALQVRHAYDLLSKELQ